jgi:dTDP-4-amino-4,6-dideoxy-D-galactose acyltransferase
MKPAPCEHLAWDSSFFRKRIGRVTQKRLDGDAILHVLAWSRAEAVSCLYLLSDLADGETSRLAHEGGFLLVDVRMTMTAGPSEQVGVEGPAIVRMARSEDSEALRAIARVSHRDARFYADPHFARADCDRLYETWIQQSCEGYADAVLVAELAGSAVGYASCHKESNCSGRIGLFAVGPQGRGRGVARQLLSEVRLWFGRQGITTVNVVTQGSNVRAQRCYQRGGFLTSAMELWHHRWFKRDD